MARQEYDTADVVRLEITRDPEGAEQRNLISNPDGTGGDGDTERRGGWGWSAPVDGSAMRWQWLTSPTVTYLEFGSESLTTPELFFQSQRAVIVGKTHLAATWTHLAAEDYVAGGGHTPPWHACGEFRFWDANGTFLESSPPSPWSDSALGAAGFATVPVGAYYASLRIYVGSNLHGAPFGAGTAPRYALTDVTMLAWDADPGLSLSSSTNLLANPTFDVNTSSWAPSGCTISSASAPTPYQGTGVLRLAITANPADVFSSMFATTAGQIYTLTARARIGSVATRARAWFEFYNASNVLVGSRIYGALVTTDTSWQKIRVSATAPAGSTKVRCGLQSIDATGGTSYFDAALLEQTNQGNLWFSGTRSTPTAALPATPNQYWTEITDAAQSIATTRVGGDVGTLTADLVDPALDPATNPLLRPGRAVRLSGKGTGTWQRMATTRAQNVRTAYELLNDVSDRRRVTLEAADAFATLAAVRTPGGSESLYQWANKLEQLALPFNLLNSRNISASDVDYYTADVSVLDALLIARDSNTAYAWTNVHGVICAETAEWLGDPTPLTDNDYNGALRVSYDTAELVNSVTITELVGTSQTTTGPYEDGESIARWGRRTATYTVSPDVPGYTRAAYAAAILAANAHPVVTVESATIPLHTLERIDQWAGTELYQPFTVSIAELGYSADLLVQSVAHTITKDKWLMALTFTNPDRIPIPTTGG